MILEHVANHPRLFVISPAQLDADDPLAHCRDLFQLPERIIYLDGNSLGAMPKAVPPRMKHALEHEWAVGLIRSWNDADWYPAPQRVGNRIARIIGDINQIQTGIAAAVEQQAATTAEITHSIGTVAERTSTISASMSTLSEGARNAVGAALDTDRAARQLLELSSSLEELVGQFQLGDRGLLQLHQGH